MTNPSAKDPHDLSRHRTSTQHFLFSSTAALQPEHHPSGPAGPEAEALLSVFPELLWGPRLVESALERLSDAAAFSALAVHIEALAPTASSRTEEGTRGQVRLAAARAIDLLCRDADGFWGMVDASVFGCFFDGRDADAGHALARGLHAALAETPAADARIGVAAFPLLAYPRRQVLANALKALDHAAFFDPGSTVVFDAVSLNISGDQRYQEGDIAGAAADFQAGLELDPANVNLHNSLGVCYGVMGAYEAAAEAFQTAIRLDPREVMAHYNAGFVRALQGKHAEALNFYLHAAELDTDLYEVALQIGDLYLQLGAPDKARPFIAHAVALRPESGPAHASQGRCLEALQQTTEAVAAYEKAIRLNPFDADSISALGLLYAQRDENPDIALMFCQKSVDIDPQKGLFRYRLGRLMVKYERFAEALEAFKRAEALGYDSTDDIVDVQNRLTAKAS